jgi:hypothetical protein
MCLSVCLLARPHVRPPLSLSFLLLSNLKSGLRLWLQMSYHAGFSLLYKKIQFHFLKTLRVIEYKLGITALPVIFIISSLSLSLYF